MKTLARAKRHPYLAPYALAANGILHATTSGFSILAQGILVWWQKPQGSLKCWPGFGKFPVQVAHLLLCKVVLLRYCRVIYLIHGWLLKEVCFCRRSWHETLHYTADKSSITGFDWMLWSVTRRGTQTQVCMWVTSPIPINIVNEPHILHSVAACVAPCY